MGGKPLDLQGFPGAIKRGVVCLPSDRRKSPPGPLQGRKPPLFLMYWQISRPMPDLPGGGATLFLAGEDHAYYEKAK